jgi:hypothetical protein
MDCRLVIAVCALSSALAYAQPRDPDNNPPGPRGGRGTSWETLQGLKAGREQVQTDSRAAAGTLCMQEDSTGRLVPAAGIEDGKLEAEYAQKNALMIAATVGDAATGQRRVCLRPGGWARSLHVGLQSACT